MNILRDGKNFSVQPSYNIYFQREYAIPILNNYIFFVSKNSILFPPPNFFVSLLLLGLL